MPELRIQHLAHAYGRVVSLRDIHLVCPSRSITCLLGPSGCGKSTLLRCLAGHERIAAGGIFLDGTCLVDNETFIPPEARRIGMVFQDYALFPHLKVWQNVAFGLRHLAPRARRMAAEQALAMFGVAGLADRYPHTCSGGQQQRVALARSLAPRPDVLLLDEPFSGLDANLREDLGGELRRVLRGEGMTTVMVTHDPREALACADRIAILREGRLIQAGPPDEIWRCPVDLATMRLFGKVQCFSGCVEGGVCRSCLGQWPCAIEDGAYCLAVRAEAFHLGDGGVVGQIVLSSVLAAERTLVVRIGDDTEVRIRTDAREALGENCSIRVDPRLVAYFPADVTAAG